MIRDGVLVVCQSGCITGLRRWIRSARYGYEFRLLLPHTHPGEYFASTRGTTTMSMADRKTKTTPNPLLPANRDRSDTSPLSASSSSSTVASSIPKIDSAGEVPELLSGAPGSWVLACPTSKVKDQKGKLVVIDGRKVVLFRVKGEYHALDEPCFRMCF